MRRAVVSCIATAVCVGGACHANGDGEWLVAMSGPVYEAAFDVEPLDDSVLVTGGFTHRAMFGAGRDGQATLESAGSWDLFVARYDRDDGHVAAVTRWGGPQMEVACAIDTWFDSSSIVASGNQVLRFRPDLSLEWERAVGTAVGTANELTLWDVAAVSDDAYLVLGYFYGEATIGDAPQQVSYSTPLGRNRLFVARFDRDGKLEWAVPLGGSRLPVNTHFAVRADASFVVAGCFTDTATFGAPAASAAPTPAASASVMLASQGCYDVFVASFGAGGMLEWARRAGGAACDCPADLALAPDGSILVAGGFYDAPATFGLEEPNETTLESKGDRDMFVARFTPSGSLTWARSAGDAGYDTAHRVSVQPDGRVVIAGEESGSAVVARWSAAGELLDMWRPVTGAHTDTIGVETMSDCSAIVYGTYSGTGTFAPAGSTLKSTGSFDGFVMRAIIDGCSVASGQ